MIKAAANRNNLFISEIDERPLRLRVYPDDVLKEKSGRVENFNSSLEQLSQDMLVFMREHNGIGLAAPQVGVLKRIVVAELYGSIFCLVNPRIRHRAGSAENIEGCLSVPNKSFQVKRNTEINIQARDVNGKKIRLKAQDLLARLLQHEIDHLDGILIRDSGTPVTGLDKTNSI